MTDHSGEQWDMVDRLRKERDDYILKQKVWEAANDELRSADIAMRRVLRKIVETAQEHPAKANFVAVHRQIIGEARELLRSQSTSGAQHE